MQLQLLFVDRMVNSISWLFSIELWMKKKMNNGVKLCNYQLWCELIVDTGELLENK